MDLIERASNMEILQKHIPQLRFPDFLNDKEWEVKRLGEVCRLTNGMAFKPSDWIETGIPIVRIQNLNDENAPFNYCAPEIIDDRCMIDTGTLLFSWSGTPGTSFGAFIWNRGKAVLNQHIFIVKPVEIDKVFLKMAIDANMTSIIEKSHGGAGLRHITKSDFEDIRISVPKDIAEQRRIAACLSALDEMLAATNGKLEQLKVYKKGLMQNLFNQQGGVTNNINKFIVGRLRFPEFYNEKEWIYYNGDKMFEPIVNKNHNSDLPVLAITQDQGAIPRDLIDYTVIVSDKSVEGYKVVEIGDFIISLRSFQGGIEYSNYRGLCSPAYIVLRKRNDNVCDDFYRYYFKSNQYIQDLNRNLEGIRDGKMVSYKQFSEIMIPCPKYEEQRKIASCLSSMDDQINAYTEKVGLLGQYKKGLMQRMFLQNQMN